MLRFLNNLRLAQRLGLAFGALTVALVVMALVGVLGVHSVANDTDRLSDRDVPAMKASGDLNASVQALVRLSADYVFVHADDPKTRDEVEQTFTLVDGLSQQAIATLRRTTRGPRPPRRSPTSSP